MNPPLLHVVTGDSPASRPDFVAVARRLLRACGPDLALHLRLREASGARFLELASELASSAARAGGWCVVNERLDIALAAAAQAVQLGRAALPLGVARSVVETSQAGGREDGLQIGASVHGREEAQRAVRDGANYLVLGTIFASRTHPGVQPHGAAIVERCRSLGVPIIAIGGIDAPRVPELRRAGASGIAVVRAVWRDEDPVAAARRLIAAWNESKR